MSYLLIAMFVFVCLILLGWGLAERGRIYEFPFLAAAVLLGWALPQLFGLAGDRFLPPGAFDKAMIMTVLCTGMILAGRLAAQQPFPWFNWRYDAARLTWASAVLALLGGYFFLRISRLPEDMTAATQWTGLPVAYIFLAEMLTYGFAIALLVFVRTRSFPSLLVVLYCSIFYLDRIVIAGRRAAAIDFVFAILLALWFQRRIVIPRWLILTVLVLGGIGVHSIGDYRSISESDEGFSWDRLSEIDFIGNLEELIARGGNEMRNASAAISAVDATQQFDLGLWHWNTLVFNFVPAQIVGRDFKTSLYIPYDDPLTQFRYIADTGSTWTGMTDAFRSFWYFGALKFFLIALIMGKLYRAAMSGNVTAQILYMLLLGASLHAITHHTQRFVSGAVQLAILMMPVLFAFRLPRLRRAHRPAEAGPRAWSVGVQRNPAGGSVRPYGTLPRRS